MSRLIAILVLLVLLVVVIGVGLNWLIDGETRRIDAAARLAYEQGRARAMVIEAQGQARLDSAIASQVLLTSALPWGVLAILGLFGVGLLVVAIFWLIFRVETARHQPGVVYLAHPGWQALGGEPDRLLLDVERKQIVDVQQ